MDESQMISLGKIRSAGARLIELLGLESAPVGVRFIRENDEIIAGALLLNQHRYCQALMRARRV